jgi:hypothetical protein
MALIVADRVKETTTTTGTGTVTLLGASTGISLLLPLETEHHVLHYCGPRYFRVGSGGTEHTPRQEQH